MLRALQEKTFEPVGSDKTVRVDVRIIAASHVNLRSAISARTFREDLYYRLAVFPLEIPPLRARREDIIALSTAHLAEVAARTGHGPWSLDPATVLALSREEWPGNVRQLVNALERAAIVVRAGGIAPEHLGLPVSERATPTPPPSVAPTALAALRAEERNVVERALARAGGKIHGADGAAAALGLRPTTLQSRLKKLGLR